MRLLTFVILINALMIGQIGGADLGNSEWQRIKTRPHPPRRIEPTMITVGDRLYLIGGADFQKRRFFDDIWRWVDPDTRQRSETLSANQQACNACTWEPEGRTDRSVWLQGPAFESISALIYFHGGITETDRLEDGVFAYNTNTGGVIDVTPKREAAGPAFRAQGSRYRRQALLHWRKHRERTHRSGVAV